MALPSSPQGPGFIFLYHPALGPLWDVISQKVVGGSLAPRSELVLELAEARLLDVHVDGSLQVGARVLAGCGCRQGGDVMVAAWCWLVCCRRAHGLEHAGLKDGRRGPCHASA